MISDSDFQYKNMYNIQHCRLAGLADLDQDNQFVNNYLVQWINDLVNNF
jgi:alpha-amylase